jgi:hypothetical protein
VYSSSGWRNGVFYIFFVPLCQTNCMCLVTPVSLVVFGTSLNASQSVCEMVGIEFLVFKCTYPIACPECQQIRAWVKSLRDDRSFRQSFRVAFS